MIDMIIVAVVNSKTVLGSFSNNMSFTSEDPSNHLLEKLHVQNLIKLSCTLLIQFFEVNTMVHLILNLGFSGLS